MNKIQFRNSATEVTHEAALELWNENQKLYAYDEKNEVEYNIKTKHDLNLAISLDHVLFIINY
jgi:hypothetical protein